MLPFSEHHVCHLQDDGLLYRSGAHHHRGRIDIVIKTTDYIYVMEIKLDGSADEALQQIHEKGYAEPYRKDGRKVFLVGVNFSSDTKGVEEWKVEECLF